MSRYANLANTNSKLDTLDQSPTISVQYFDRIGKTDAYRIVASHAPFKNIDYPKAVARTFNNMLVSVPDSLTVHREDNIPVVSMIVRANVDSLPFNEENVQNMKSVRANIFMDSDDNIWSVEGEGENRRLVQNAKEDLDEILSARLGRFSVQAAEHKEPETFYNGDFISYYNTKFNKVRAGIGFHTKDGDIVLDVKNKTRYNLEHAAVIAAGTIPDEDKRIEIDASLLQTSLPSSAANAHLDYMRKLFGNHPEYYNKLVELVKNQQRGHSA